MLMVWRVIVARSRACVVVLVACAVVCMDISRLVPCGVVVWLYLCIYICACGCVGGGVVVVCSCVWIDIYNGGSLVFTLVCIYWMKCYIQNSNNFHA